MKYDPTERRKRIETTEREASPSAGWREVYAEMGVSSSGDAEEPETTNQRDRSVEEETNVTGADSGRSVAARS